MTTLEPSGLADLVGEALAAGFVADYFDVQPLHVRGEPGRFTTLFGPDELLAIAADREAGAQFNCNFMEADRIFESTRQKPTVRIDGEGVPVMLAAGATIALRHVERYDARVARLVAGIRRDLAWAGEISCSSFYSPRGLGVPPHMDSSAIFILQVEGSKTWRISRRPALPWTYDIPLQLSDGSTVFLDVAGKQTDGEPWEQTVEPLNEATSMEVTMGPGDLLFMPAGTWHTTRASNEGSSLSLNLHLEALAPLDLFLDVLRPMLRPAVEWRRVPPQQGPVREGLPSGFQRYVRDRIGELRAALDELERMPPGWEQAWKRRIAEAGGSGAGRPPVEIRSDDRLRLAPTVTLVVERDGAGQLERVTFFHGDQEVAIDEPAFLPLAERLVTQGAVIADEKRDLLQALVNLGILERSSES